MTAFYRRVRKHTDDWVGNNKYRQRARRRTKQLLAVWVLAVVFVQIFGRLGLTSKLLSPNVGLTSVSLVALAAALVLMRLALVLLAPSALAFVWVRALWPTRASKPQPAMPTKMAVSASGSEMNGE
jgi:hypothetical protein